MGLLDIIDKYSGGATDLYSLYKNHKDSKNTESNIRSGDPWLPVNQQNAAALSKIYADGGQAYMSGESAQNQMNIGNEAYFRTQQGSGDRLSTGAAERRESQSLTLYDQILNAQIGRLKGAPASNPNTGEMLAQNTNQKSFNYGYGVEQGLKSLGNLFSGGGSNKSNTSGNFRTSNRTGSIYNDGWFE